MHAVRHIVSPILWSLGFLMFLMPWVSIRCDGGKELGELSMAGGGGGGSTTIELARQNGFQVMTGDHSLTPDGEMAMKGEKSKPTDISSGPAYLLWIFFLGLLVCIIGGFGLPSGKIRRILLPSAAGLAIVGLGAQTAIGLPGKDPDFVKKLVPIPGAEGAKVSKAPPIYSVYGIGFYGAWVFAVIATGLTGLELLGQNAKPVPARRSRRNRRDRDDEDQEEDDDS